MIYRYYWPGTLLIRRNSYCEINSKTEIITRKRFDLSISKVIEDIVKMDHSQ